VVPRAWTLLFAEMTGRPDLAASLTGPEPHPPDGPVQERVWAFLARDVRRLADVHGLPLSEGF
jgi:hypothetical protein